MDMETGSYIQQHIQLLEFIKMEMGEIAGVSQQRQGQVENRETVGGVERAVNQSSHITEYWFMLHEQCKIRVMNCFLETAKIALKGKNKKVQYILDDQAIQVLNIDDEDSGFSENDYGLILTTSSRTQELEQMIKQNAQAFMQNGGSLSTIMDIYFSPSLSDMRRRLEDAEEQMHQRQSESSQQANETQQAANQALQQLEMQKLELEDIISQREDATKRYVAELNHSISSEGIGEDGIENPLDKEKLNANIEKSKQDYVTKMKALDQDMLKHKDNVELKKESNQINRIKKKQ